MAKVKLDYEKMGDIMKALGAKGRWLNRLKKLEKSQGYIEIYTLPSGTYYWTVVRGFIFTKVYYIDDWWVKEWLR